MREREIVALLERIAVALETIAQSQAPKTSKKKVVETKDE